MRELKIGDRVKITKPGWYNNKFEVGDIVYIVGAVSYGSSTECPWYLSKLRQKRGTRGLTQHFAPYRENYEHIPNKNTIGGKIL